MSGGGIFATELSLAIPGWVISDEDEGGGGGTTLTAPIDVPPGSTIVMANASPNYHNMDMSTGPAIVVDLPPAPAPGQVYRAKNGGLGVTAATINATGGATIEDPANPGHYSVANGNVSFGGLGKGEWAEWIFNGIDDEWQLSSLSP